MKRITDSLKTIDGLILDNVFQPIVDSLQHITTAKQLSMFFLLGNMLSVVAVFVLKIEQSNVDIILGVYVLGAPYLYYLHNQTDHTSNARNPMRFLTSMVILRLWSLPTAIWTWLNVYIDGSLANVVFGVSQLCFAMFMYFGACDRPPRRMFRQSNSVLS